MLCTGIQYTVFAEFREVTKPPRLSFLDLQNLPLTTSHVTSLLRFTEHTTYNKSRDYT
jgi:hypothetical protein